MHVLQHFHSLVSKQSWRQTSAVMLVRWYYRPWFQNGVTSSTIYSYTLHGANWEKDVWLSLCKVRMSIRGRLIECTTYSGIQNYILSTLTATSTTIVHWNLPVFYHFCERRLSRPDKEAKNSHLPKEYGRVWPTLCIQHWEVCDMYVCTCMSTASFQLFVGVNPSIRSQNIIIF